MMEKDLILSRAKSAAIARDFQTAIKLYKSLLKNDVSNVELLNLIGTNYVKLGDDEKALKYYEQIITFSPENVDAMNSMGAIYRRLKRYQDSINILQKALEEDKNTATVNYNLGFTYKEMGDFDDAIAAFSSVVDENPSDVLAYNHLGSIYYQKKAYQKSIACFKRGLQVDPNHPILQYNLAKCYEAEKQYSEAVRCYETALKARPGWIDALHDFSELLIKCQKTEEARGIVKRTIDLNPEDARLYMLLGEVYLNEFDYDSAISAYTEAESKDENNVRILKGLAEALENGEEPQEAVSVMDKILKLEPENKDVKKQYVHALLSAEEYEQAYTHVDTLYKENGEDDAQILDLYGQYYVCVDDDENAKKYFDKIPTVDPKYSLYLLEAANRYSQIGKIHQAEELAKKYITKNPKDVKAYNSLGKIYTKKGDAKAALETYSKGINITQNNVLAKKRIKKLTNKDYEDNSSQSSFMLSEMPEKSSENHRIEKPVENQIEEASNFSDIIGKARQKYDEEMNRQIQNGGLNAIDLPENDSDFSNFAENQEAVDINSIPDEVLVKEEDQYIDDTVDNSAPFDLLDDEASPEKIFDNFQEKKSDNNSRNVPETAAENKTDVSPEPQLMMESSENQENPDNSESLSSQPPVSNVYNNPETVIEEAVPDLDLSNQLAQKAMETLQNLDEKISQKEEELNRREDELSAKEETLLREEQQKQEEYSAKKEEIKQAEMQLKQDQEDFEKKVNENQQLEDDFTDEMKAAEEEFLDLDDLIAEKSFESVEKDVENEQSNIIIEDAADESTVNIDEDNKPVNEETEISDTSEETLDELEELDEPGDLFGVDEELIQANIINEDAPFEDIISAAAEVAAENELSNTKDEKIDELEEVDYSVLDPMDTIRRFLPNVEKILEDTDYAHAHETELELFIKMKKFCEFLPEEELSHYKSSRIRMLLDYLIARFSGKPGLLVTAESLMKAGFLGEGVWQQKYEDSAEELPFEEEVKIVLNYMKELTRNLHSQNIAGALRTEADKVLEKLELKNC